MFPQLIRFTSCGFNNAKLLQQYRLYLTHQQNGATKTVCNRFQRDDRQRDGKADGQHADTVSEISTMYPSR